MDNTGTRQTVPPGPGVGGGGSRPLAPGANPYVAAATATAIAAPPPPPPLPLPLPLPLLPVDGVAALAGATEPPVPRGSGGPGALESQAALRRMRTTRESRGRTAVPRVTPPVAAAAVVVVAVGGGAVSASGDVGRARPLARPPVGRVAPRLLVAVDRLSVPATIAWGDPAKKGVQGERERARETNVKGRRG